MNNLRDEYILILNLGLRSVRAILFDLAGNKIRHEWLPVKTTIQGNKVEQNPSEWWEMSKEVIKKAVKDISSIRYISVTSSSCCLVVLDEEGKPLCNSLMVSDKRSDYESSEIFANFPHIFANKTFIASPSYMMPKILWLKKNEPEIFSKAAKFVSSNDFLIYNLTGKFVTDPLNAEKFYYDTNSGSYNQELLDFIGIKKDQLPLIENIGSNLGKIQNIVAKDLGFDADVILTTYDALCAFWGSGTSKNGDACLVGGTCLSLRAYSETAPEISKEGIFAQKYSIRNVYSIGGSNNIGGGLLEWAKQCFYDKRDGDEVFAQMEKDAKNSPAGSNGLLFLPYLLGERTPFYNPEARGIFFGIERFHTRNDIIRSVFESVGYLSLNLINSIEEIGVKINTIRLSGGLSKNIYIAEIIANITGKDIIVIDEVETTSLGSFSLILLSKNPEADLSELVKYKYAFKPDPHVHKKYKELYYLFSKIYLDNLENFKIRDRILQSINSQRAEKLDSL